MKIYIKRILMPIFSLLLIFSMLTPMLPLSAAEQYIEISTKEGLNAVRFNPTANYKLVSDIYFDPSDFEAGGMFYNSGKGWLPIGMEEETTFCGIFNGNGHKISGLVTRGSTNEYEQMTLAGLFGLVDFGSVIKNLTVSNFTVECESSYFLAAGAVAGYTLGTIEGCLAERCNINVVGKQKVEDDPVWAGGVAGCALVVRNCASSSNVNVKTNGYACVGGVVGEVLDKYTDGEKELRGTITQSANIGAVSVEFSNASDALKESPVGVGGVAGIVTDVTVDQCYNTGKISAKTANNESIYFLGGVIGCGFFDTASIENCFNAGRLIFDASCEGAVGGITGYNEGNVKISKCYHAGGIDIVKGASLAGTIAGYNEADVENCFYLLASGADGATGGGTNVNLVPTTKLDMMNPLSYSGFDFNNVWEMKSDNGYFYPQLKNMELSHLPEGETTPVTAPDCIMKGRESFVCANCQNTIMVDIPATGEHNYGDWQTISEPTEGNYGIKQRICYSCGTVDEQFIDYEDIGTRPVGWPSSEPYLILVLPGTILGLALGTAITVTSAVKASKKNKKAGI